MRIRSVKTQINKGKTDYCYVWVYSARSTRVFRLLDGTMLHSRLTDTPNSNPAQIRRALGIWKCPAEIQNNVAPKRR